MKVDLYTESVPAIIAACLAVPIIKQLEIIPTAERAPDVNVRKNHITTKPY